VITPYQASWETFEKTAPDQAWDAFFPPRMRHFWRSVYRQGCPYRCGIVGKWEPVLGFVRSLENRQQRDKWVFSNSLLGGIFV
jgi:hypothetical protein